jgi:hypothetical protein
VKIIRPSRLLQLALSADAAVSGGVGLLQLAASAWLSQLLQLPQTLLTETGAFLIVYAVLLVLLARSASVWRVLISLIVVGNIGWAAGCAVLVISGTLSPNALGMTYLALQAIAVITFAALEFKGLANSASASGVRAAST